MQSPKGTVEGDGSFVGAIVKHHLETSRSSDDKLMALLMGMSATLLSARNVVTLEDAVNLERHMDILIDKRQVAFRIVHLVQFVERTVEHTPGITDCIRH